MTEENLEKKQVNTKTARTRKSATAQVTKKTTAKTTKARAKKEVKEGGQKKETVARKPRKTNQEKTSRNVKKSKKSIFKASKLKIIPLVGLHEIGKNITVFEYENEIVIVDCGLSFPEDDMLGVDLVIPDITYLEKNVDKIKGLVITHGHEDHIGSIPYLLKKINVPIYGTKLTVGLIKNKLEEHKLLRTTKLNEVSQGDKIKLGKNFEIEFIRSTHSIPDSVMLAITTPAGTVLHTGDFKVDFTPIDGKIMDFGRIAELGGQGVLALMSDSTNSERKGFTMSESSVGEVFDKLFLHCTKRIVVATFASNVHRVQQIVNSAIKYNRKIAVCGRSMINMIKKSIFKASKLKIIPLVGLHEIGKNITVFEYENEIVIVDCGLSFPEDDMLGVDLVIPDITYLEKNVDKIKGLVITHGHEDHIGSIPYLLKKINVPIYGTKLTVGLIKNKLEEHKLLRTTKLNEVSQGDKIKLGKNFEIEFIRSTHSIPDSVMLAITTPAGTVLHTGDFKVDFTPIDGKIMDFGRIAELGGQGVLALMSDSTNSERKGFTMSESSVGEVFDKLFLHCTKRIVVATFASNVHRVQQIVNSAIKYNRKIAVCGRSMINMITTARELGYIECPENIFIDIDMIKNYTDDQLVIITTGSQGEPMSALTRMAAGDHRKVKITPNDLVIISATPIPGNEKFVSKVIDDLMQIGAEVVYSALEDIHVSGHACQEEQKLIIALAKPKYFIPVHGEYRQLISHSETAQSMGIDKENIIMLQNGRVLEINEDGAEFTNTVQNGKVLVDGLGVGDVGNIVLRDRQHLSQDGLIVIVLTMDSSTGEVIAGPDVISRGFVYVRESENLMDDVKSVVRHEIKKCEDRGVRDWSTIKSTVRENLRDYIFSKTKRNPMIIPIIMEV